MFFQAAIDQLLAPETLDRIVDILANGDFCAAFGDERCPAAVDVVIRQGLPTNIKIHNVICNIIYISAVELQGKSSVVSCGTLTRSN